VPGTDHSGGSLRRAFTEFPRAWDRSPGWAITTSRYTCDALEYAQGVSDSIVLVDGPRLAELMIDHHVGVDSERTIEVPKLDAGYFEDSRVAAAVVERGRPSPPAPRSARLSDHSAIEAVFEPSRF